MPFKNRIPNSLSAAARHYLPWFIAGVAVRAGGSPNQGDTLTFRMLVTGMTVHQGPPKSFSSSDLIVPMVD
jgi:hypothetical protein